ncbi:MAG: S-methyl-5-thioribose-1-phosphate isomerase [Anaerolineaceae bacterium]|nr:S-methyl-5-thioribose-1-phosphate isomerase [Anaerolineaceae bacterium]
MRTLEWSVEKNELKMIDQRLLPGQFEIITFQDHIAVSNAIRDMVVRGAPAIGAAAAFGLTLAAFNVKTTLLNEFKNEVHEASIVLLASRPTAVNLSWAIRRMLAVMDTHTGSVSDMQIRLLEEAQTIADEDIEINKRMASYGATLIEDGDTIIHHCNTGALATVDWGTALGVIRMAHEMGKKIHVLVDETRPRLQGSRLTAWELQRYGVPFDIITDNSAGYFLRTGQVQKVVFGADRVAANGDVANKIGTYMLALSAHANQIPAYCVVPMSTIDFNLDHGDLIPIEERDPDEVLGLNREGHPIAPEGAKARNPAFDVTPNQLVTALVTEKGIIYPPFGPNLLKVKSEQ